MTTNVHLVVALVLVLLFQDRSSSDEESVDLRNVDLSSSEDENKNEPTNVDGAALTANDHDYVSVDNDDVSVDNNNATN